MSGTIDDLLRCFGMPEDQIDPFVTAISKLAGEAAGLLESGAAAIGRPSVITEGAVWTIVTPLMTALMFLELDRFSPLNHFGSELWDEFGGAVEDFYNAMKDKGATRQ